MPGERGRLWAPSRRARLLRAAWPRRRSTPRRRLAVICHPRWYCPGDNEAEPVQVSTSPPLTKMPQGPGPSHPACGGSAQRLSSRVLHGGASRCIKRRWAKSGGYPRSPVVVGPHSPLTKAAAHGVQTHSVRPIDGSLCPSRLFNLRGKHAPGRHHRPLGVRAAQSRRRRRI